MKRPPASRSLVLDGLPAVSPLAPSASLEIARLLSRLPNPSSLRFGMMGAVEIRCDRFELGKQASDEMEDLWFEMGGEPACVSLERRLAVQLVSAACGRESSPLARPLKLSERGVLGALLTAALATTHPANRPTLRSCGGQVVFNQEVRNIGFSVSSSIGVGGRGCLCAPAAFFSRMNLARTSWWRSSSAYLPVSVELARIPLSAEAIGVVRPGDGIVFSGWKCPTAGSDWPVVLRICELGIHALLAAAGTVRIVTGFFQEREVQSMTGLMNADDGETQVDLPTAEEILAAAPTTVVAELGRVVVRGDELAGLVPGAVLSLGPVASNSLDLRIEGQLWAKGELVRVGDELAVRITQLTGG